MWVFSKNTIAGDLGVTPIIQCLASMLITSTLVHTDLHHHAIAPLPFVYPHVEHLPDPRSLFHKPTGSIASEPEKADEDVKATKRGLRYYFWMLVRFIFEGTEKNMMAARIPVTHWFGRLAWTAAQGAAIGIVFGFPLWCLAVLILGPIYGNDNMGNKWAPQAIKCVYGAILGWITNPVIATLALGSQAPCHLVVVEHDQEEGGVEHPVEGVPTIHEDQEFIASPTIGRRSMLAVSPALSPSRHMSSLPLPGTPSLSGRSRAGSNASRMSKPPLTTNASLLPPLPSPGDEPSALPASPTPDRSGRPRGNSYTIPQRPRGATVSSYSSNRSYSYALGGTGGRAQRPRAASRASAAGTTTAATGIPSLVLPVSEVAQRSTSPTVNNLTVPGRSPREAPTAAWDVFGRNDTPPGLSMSSPPSTRQRAQSAVERSKPKSSVD